MAAFAQALTQGLGRAGNEYGQARQGLLGERLQLLQSAIALQEIQQRIAESKQQMEFTGEQQKVTTDPGYLINKRMPVARQLGLQPGTFDYLQFVVNGKLPSTTTLKSLQKNVVGSDLLRDYPGILTPMGEKPDPAKHYDVFQNSDGAPVAMSSGEALGATTPKPFNYVGQDGLPHRGFTIGLQAYGEDQKPLPPGTQVFSAWMEPLTTTTESMKEVVQPDGSIKLVPVEQTSTRVRGRQTGPPGLAAPGGQPSTPGPPQPKPARVLGPGVAAGGRVPSGVSKAYEAYNGAQERYNVMQDALPRALQGDQQAMLNLLANHVGMTMGLQKGARITQGVYSEAEQSAPWLQRVAARFDEDGYLSGVVLTPPQMTQMIELAKVRLEQDRQAWQREIQAAKEGYGMSDGTGGGPPGPWNNY